MCLARTCLFLRTKAMSHRSAASSGHRQKTVAGGMNLNEEMEKKEMEQVEICEGSWGSCIWFSCLYWSNWLSKVVSENKQLLFYNLTHCLSFFSTYG